MAVLTDADVADIWGPFFENYQDIIKAEGDDGFLSLDDVRELFQAIEDWSVSGYLTTPTAALKTQVLTDLTNWSVLSNGFLQPAIASYWRFKAEASGF